MSVIDKVTVGGTTYDVQDSVAVHFAEQTLTDVQKRQTRVNVSAEEASAVEIVPDTKKYIYLDNPETDGSVDIVDDLPDMRNNPNSQSLNILSALIEVTQGEVYSIDCTGVSAHAPGMLVIKADGTILDRKTGTAEANRDTRTVIIPENAKWLYVIQNFATGSNAKGTSNRFWRGAYTPVRVSMLENAVTELDGDVTALGTTKQDVTAVNTVSGSTPSITAADNTVYKCGTVTSLSITAPATGLFTVRWTAAQNFTPILTGITMPEWWVSCESGRVYELSVQDGFGAVMSWATT